MNSAVFSLDACKAMIALEDVSSQCLGIILLTSIIQSQVDGSNTLDFDEFISLLQQIGSWKVLLSNQY